MPHEDKTFDKSHDTFKDLMNAKVQLSTLPRFFYVLGVPIILIVVMLAAVWWVSYSGLNGDMRKSAAPNEGLVIQQGLNQYRGAVDATLHSDRPNRNYGSDINLIVQADSWIESVIRFDLSSIPVGSQIERAQVELYLKSKNDPKSVTLNIYQLLWPWVERQVTWTKAASGQSWGSEGANKVGVDRAQRPTTSGLVSATTQWYAFDITSLVQQWLVNPNSNFGFLLKGDGSSGTEFRFASSEDAISTLRPKLTVWLTGSGSATPTVMPTSVVPSSTPTPFITLIPSVTPTRVPTITPTRTPTPVITNAPSGITRLNMKSYGNHNATYDARILSIRPQYVIDNPPHGLYGEMENPKYTASWLLQNVAGYQAAGIKVIGYITSGYEGSGGDDHYAAQWYSLATNRMLITNMATIDHVDGVFIDECSDYPNAASKTYLKNLADLAHSYGLIVWGNTGVDEFDPWYFNEGGFDLMQSSESWVGQSLSTVQRTYGSRISVTGFRSSYTAADAVRLTLDAWSKGIAYAYINTAEYTSIAPWFETYANSLREQQNNYTWPPVPQW